MKILRSAPPPPPAPRRGRIKFTEENTRARVLPCQFHGKDRAVLRAACVYASRPFQPSPLYPSSFFLSYFLAFFLFSDPLIGAVALQEKLNAAISRFTERNSTGCRNFGTFAKSRTGGGVGGGWIGTSRGNLKFEWYEPGEASPSKFFG